MAVRNTPSVLTLRPSWIMKKGDDPWSPPHFNNQSSAGDRFQDYYLYLNFSVLNEIRYGRNGGTGQYDNTVIGNSRIRLVV